LFMPVKKCQCSREIGQEQKVWQSPL
jgi:hypothetical protein